LEIDKSRIFEKFQRGSNVPKDDSPGSGLGLFLVKSLVERWGGHVELESEENKGTTVNLCIPVEKVIQ
jgi:two-component system, OmpR family, phosphate regulon sensor histidine kinase PhoR